MVEKREMEGNVVSQQKDIKMSMTYKVMLCLFFWYLFRITISGVPQMVKTIIPDIFQSDSPAFFSLFYIDWALWVFYGFWAILLALKGSSSAIPCLKLCLPFHFIAVLINIMSRTSSFGFGTLLPLLVLLFPLIFLIYLCSSKAIKTEYPKESRTLGRPGVTGIFLYILLGLLVAQILVLSYRRVVNSKKVDPDNMELLSTEMTDGRVIFSPNVTWQLDSTATQLSTEDTFYFQDTLNRATIRVSCTSEEYEPLRHYYIYTIAENQPFDMRSFKGEIGHRQFETDDVVVFADQYEYCVDSARYYWTYASRLGKKVDKGLRLSVVQTDSLNFTMDDALEFLNTSTFDVRERLLKND